MIHAVYPCEPADWWKPSPEGGKTIPDIFSGFQFRLAEQFYLMCECQAEKHGIKLRIRLEAHATGSCLRCPLPRCSAVRYYNARVKLGPREVELSKAKKDMLDEIKSHIEKANVEEVLGFYLSMFGNRNDMIERVAVEYLKVQKPPTMEEVEPSEQKEFTCLKCNKAFATQKALDTHKRFSSNH